MTSGSNCKLYHYIETFEYPVVVCLYTYDQMFRSYSKIYTKLLLRSEDEKNVLDKHIMDNFFMSDLIYCKSKQPKNGREYDVYSRVEGQNGLKYTYCEEGIPITETMIYNSRPGVKRPL